MARTGRTAIELDLELLLVAWGELRWCAVCATSTPHDQADAEAVCALCGAAVFVAGRLAWPERAGRGSDDLGPTPRAA